jgi:crotonobetainyl-CoA:carnitine CoA-transferase CaiB-like acyl-CoA transferase
LRRVRLSLSGFGHTGPWAGRASYDIVAQASGGLMAMTGAPDGPSTRGGGALGDFVGGLYLAFGIVAALLERERNGTARVLDLSNQDAIFAITDSAATIHQGIGAESERVGNQHLFTAPYDCYATQDGWVVVGTASNKLFRALCQAIGRPELADDPAYRSHRGRSQRRETVNGFVAAWMRERSCEAALEALGPSGADLPCARVESPHALVDDPQLVSRGMVERHPHPDLGEVVFHGNPLHYSDAEPRARALAPTLGEHNAEVYAEIGVDAEELMQLSKAGVV